jgi:chorismate mutase
MTLAELRKQIDTIDSQILELLEKRTSIVKQVGHLKNSDVIMRPLREARMLEDLASKTDLPDAAIKEIFRKIIAMSVNIEGQPKIFVLSKTAYLVAMEYFGSFADINLISPDKIKKEMNLKRAVLLLSKKSPYYKDTLVAGAKIFAKLPLQNQPDFLTEYYAWGFVEEEGDSKTTKVYKGTTYIGCYS